MTYYSNREGWRRAAATGTVGLCSSLILPFPFSNHFHQGPQPPRPLYRPYGARKPALFETVL